MRYESRILQIAINTPLRRVFDYLPPPDCDPGKLSPGQRLHVPFGKTRKKTGLLTGISDKTGIEPQRLKRAYEVIDNQPLFDQHHLEFLQWASNYYHHPIGEVMLGTLPAMLNNGLPAILKQARYWKLTHAGIAIDNLPANARLQKAIIGFLRSHPDGISEEYIRTRFKNWRKPLNSLTESGLVESFSCELLNNQQALQSTKPVQLNNDQKHATTIISSAKGNYQTFLLNGITGSGKTEVYIHSIKEFIDNRLQALILVPEIALTPQFIERFRTQLNTEICVLHSGLTDKERMQAWINARDGRVRIVIGTRSAIWTPFSNLGIIIVDEEHDLSYKQQEGFRYSARDLALFRAQHDNIPVVLGSATPSLETVQNVSTRGYREIKLDLRTGNACLPKINILDIRGCEMDGAVSGPLLNTISKHLDMGQQVLLFLNRRGYAPVMMCHGCGWIAKCPRCNIQMTYHKHISRLCCHHCLHQEKVTKTCPGCSNTQIIEIGHGTQRLTETLEKNFPDANIARIDRDSTRRKGAIQSMFADIQSGKTDILIGTQMLAKGHHFPNVTLVGIIDADRGLYSADFRASERMAQIIMQVGGRAGRADQPGTVIIQTHHPEHPLLITLADHDYEKITNILLDERRQADLPPFSCQVLLRAEANQQQLAERFLHDARKYLPANKQLQIYGPIVAPIEKRAGRFRMQLLLQMQNRRQLRSILGTWVKSLETLPEGRKVRWSLDVDPQDML